MPSLRGAKRRSNPPLFRGSMDCFANARNDDLSLSNIEPQLSSPAKAGDPVFQRRQRWDRETAAYWIAR